MDLGLRDRVCVITGSTGGIGLATARLLADEGARVVTSGRSHAPNAGEALHVSADLSAPDAPGELVGERARLLATRVVERLIRMTLEPPVAVPVGLAVANKQELGHGRLG